MDNIDITYHFSENTIFTIFLIFKYKNFLDAVRNKSNKNIGMLRLFGKIYYAYFHKIQFL